MVERWQQIDLYGNKLCGVQCTEKFIKENDAVLLNCWNLEIFLPNLRN